MKFRSTHFFAENISFKNGKKSIVRIRPSAKMDIFEKRTFLENGIFCDKSTHTTLIIVCCYATKYIVSLRIMGQKMDILEMSILPIAPETFETKSKNVF